MEIIIKTIFAFIATVAFGKLFYAPQKDLWPSGIVGAAGFGVYIYFMDVLGYSSMLSNFMGTIVLALLSEIFAREYKEPVTVFSVPGFIPLVPGLPLYRAMNLILLNNYTKGLATFVDACLDAMAIALGILLVSGLAKVYKTSKTIIEEKHQEAGE
jgi:uncharacterized membrane protein YjjB (DUF3815 family)